MDAEAVGDLAAVGQETRLRQWAVWGGDQLVVKAKVNAKVINIGAHFLGGFQAAYLGVSWGHRGAPLSNEGFTAAGFLDEAQRLTDILGDGSEIASLDRIRWE